MNYRHARKFSLLLVLLAVLSGCIFPDSYHAPAVPVAVRENRGQIEIVYTSCDQVKIKLVQVIDPRDDTEVKDEDPVVWQVRFDPPTDRKQFTIGQAPTGGVEEVVLAGPLGERTAYAIRIVLSDGQRIFSGFERNRLNGGEADPGSQPPCTAGPS